MPRHYQALPIDPPPDAVEIEARGDLDAVVQAKQKLGSDTPFVLWEGQRRALACGSIEDIRKARTQPKTAE